MADPSPSTSVPIPFEQLQRHFDQPLALVARKFGVCTTFFKKICRHHGIKRWPFRKLMSLEKKIQGLQTKSDSVKPHIQASIASLQDMVNQIRTCAHLDMDDDEDEEERLDMVLASPKNETRGAMSGFSASHLDYEPKWELTAILKLSAMLTHSLYSVPLVSLQPEVVARLDSIRGACVFAFDILPNGEYHISFMSRGCLDVYGFGSAELTKPGAAARLIGAIHPDDQLPYAQSVQLSKERMTEWNWQGRVYTKDESGNPVLKVIRGRSMPHALADGTVRYEGMIFEEAIVKAVIKTPDIMQGISVFEAIVGVGIPVFSRKIEEMKIKKDFMFPPFDTRITFPCLKPGQIGVDHSCSRNSNHRPENKHQATNETHQAASVAQRLSSAGMIEMVELSATHGHSETTI